MRRAVPIAALLAAFVAAWLCLPGRAASAPLEQRSVVVILAPYLMWEDVTPTSTPTLWALAGRGSIGAVNARSRARVPELGDAGSPLEGALSISAGSWAAFDRTAAAAYTVTERYEVGTAAEAFRRTTGDQVGSNRIVFLGMPVTQRVNAESSFQAVPGTLGDAIEHAGGVTAAIGNSDVGYVTGEQRRVRPSALMAMNGKGLVRLGDVSRALVTEHPYAPFGIETDHDRFTAVLDEVHEQIRGSGPSLVVLDPGDLYRVAKFRTQVTEETYRLHKARALKSFDEVIALAIERFDGATIMVVGQSTGDPEYGDEEGLAPIVVSGDGFEGYLTSSSTQRLGLVTDLDITSTILSVLGIDQPVAVLGNPMKRVSTSDSAEARAGRLSRMNATAVSVDGVRPAVVNTFVVVAVLALLLTAFVLVRASNWRPEARRRGVTAVKAALLLVLCVPISGWLMFTIEQWPQSRASSVLLLVAATFVMWGISLALWWKLQGRAAVAFVCLATSAVIMADQLLGAPGSFTNFFGYSPLLAARFYGMGNEAAAILFGASVTGLALLFDESPSSRVTAWGKRLGIPLLALAVVITAAAPWLGANVGVAIWGVIGFGLAWVVMNGHHVSWRSVFGLAVAVVLVIAAFAAIDIFGGEQTHLARALGSAEQGGVGELWTIVARKANTNARVLTRTNWSYILIATLAFLGMQRWRPHGDFGEALTENPHFADAITVTLLAGIVAYFTEDSGVVIPALAVFYIGVALSWLMLSRITYSSLESPSAEGVSER